MAGRSAESQTQSRFCPAKEREHQIKGWVSAAHDLKSIFLPWLAPAKGCRRATAASWLARLLLNVFCELEITSAVSDEIVAGLPGVFVMYPIQK